MIQLNNISKYFGDQVLFEDVNLNFSAREKVGLVGRNGTGKSTLFKMILGELHTDSGTISIPKGYKIGALEQHIHFTKPTVLEECCQVLPEDLMYETYRAEKILFGLGFTDEDLDKDPNTFSGGYQIRINLTKVLLQEPNMLLLDEPTNYLDIVSLRWLRTFLKNFQGEILIITHDRDFMDTVTTHTMGISRKCLRKFKGSTLKFYEQIVMEEEIHEQTRLNQEKKRKEMENFVDRFRAKASKATQAQSKLKQLQKMEVLEELATERNLGFKFHYEECPGKVLLTGKDLSFRYSEETPILFEGLDINIGRHDRIAIVGKNGKGKSTLLNVLAKELKMLTGEIQEHPGIRIGHFGQTNVDRLHVKNSISQEIQESNPSLSNTQIRSICGTMMFEGDLADKKIDVLSGGERARVMLGKILAHPANLLFLDEPTNHLDQESIQTLCQQISIFQGAVILVTHSEMLLRKLANKLIIFQDGKADFFDGTYDEFLDKVGWIESEEIDSSKKKKKLSYKEIKAKRSEIVGKKSKELAPLKAKIEEGEAKILALEETMEKFNELVLKASQAGDNEKISEHSQMVGRIQIKIADIFEELETYSDELEKKSKVYDKELEELS